MRVEPAPDQAELDEAAGGADIFGLLRNKEIEIEVWGRNVESLNVSLRQRTSAPITARIPAGTYFVSDNPEFQNMVITAGCDDAGYGARQTHEVRH